MSDLFEGLHLGFPDRPGVTTCGCSKSATYKSTFLATQLGADDGSTAFTPSADNQRSVLGSTLAYRLRHVVHA
ncbi:hypothetical protein, partial [Pseudomonas viridiflava]|uniref:hypothetical protein n=1 Tax=Pseudomonas viridiflava TaxID=33069 RepID=UPI00197E326D